MKYKLINNKTKEETICEKVVIDNFDYYVNNDKITSYYYNPATNNIHIESNPKRLEVVNKHKRLKIIATNNPNIDISKVISEVKTLSLEYIINKNTQFFTKHDFENGYNKAKETYQFTEEDMIDFAEWIADSKKHGYCKQLYEAMIVNKVQTTKELLQIFKEQQIKTIFYE